MPWPTPREQLDGAAAASCSEHDIVSIPGTEEAKVKQSPPYNAQNSAYIDIPGPVRKEHAVASTTSRRPIRRGRRPSSWPTCPARRTCCSLRCTRCGPATSCSSCTPTASKSMFGRLYRRLCVRRRLGALHRRDDVGRGPRRKAIPRSHIGQLLKRMLRNVRCCRAIGLHTQGMTLAQSTQTVHRRGLSGRRQRRAAGGARHLRPGLSQLHMGKLMIRKLRADWCARRGGGDARRAGSEFHDAFLSYGGPPIPLVRGAMMKASRRRRRSEARDQVRQAAGHAVEGGIAAGQVDGVGISPGEHSVQRFDTPVAFDAHAFDRGAIQFDDSAERWKAFPATRQRWLTPTSPALMRRSRSPGPSALQSGREELCFSEPSPP